MTSARSIVAFEMLAMGDLSLMVKVGVQFGLFGGAVLHLGNAEHHRRYLADIATGRLLGCFAMTEHGHGSDVAALRTTATYDPATDEFVIDTPDDAARKEYIGNAARRRPDGGGVRPAGDRRRRATACTPSWCRSATSDGQPDAGRPDRRLRSEGRPERRRQRPAVVHRRPGAAHRAARPVRLRSAADGSYTTPIENQTKRFFTMLGTLIQGRISVAGGAGSATKVALASR